MALTGKNLAEEAIHEVVATDLEQVVQFPLQRQLLIIHILIEYVYKKP